MSDAPHGLDGHSEVGPLKPMSPEVRKRTQALLEERVGTPEFQRKLAAARRRLAAELGSPE